MASQGKLRFGNWAIILAFSALIGLFGSTLAAQQARPSAEDLFPETTVLYLQIRNIRELATAMQNTSMGHLMGHEKVAPLVDELWGQAKEAYAEVQDEVGLSLEDFQNLPTGEICFAAIAPKRADMQFALIIDVDPESDAAKNVEARGREVAQKEGAAVEDEETDDAKFTTISAPDEDVKFTYFQKDGSFVITTNRDLSQQILDRWLGRAVEKVRPLKENRKFITIMNRCRGNKDVSPDIRGFIDPIEFFRSASRGDVGTQTALNFLPILGLDGLLGVGGSIIYDEQEFESVVHMHLMLANPRAGILEMIALKPADYRPQSWLSEDTGSYISTSWNLDKMYTELGKIVDQFTSEGEFQRQVDENVNERLDLDLKTDVIDSLTGRITVTNWMEPPARINSQVNGVGIELADPEKAEEIIRKLIERFSEDSDEERIVENEYKGVKYWSAPTSDEQRERLEAMREGGELGVSIRVPEPAFAIIDRTLVASDSVAFVKHAIETYKGDHNPLADNAEFADISRKMTNMLGTDMPAAVFYSQPGPTIETLLNVAKGDEVSSFLDRQGEENKYIKNIKRALDQNPLPDWDEIKDFFRPSGGFITSDESGYHVLLFQMKGGQQTSGQR